MTVVSDITEKSRAISFNLKNCLLGRGNRVFPHNKQFNYTNVKKREVNNCLTNWRQAHSSIFFKQYLDLKRNLFVRRKERNTNRINPKKLWKLLGLGTEKSKTQCNKQ